MSQGAEPSQSVNVTRLDFLKVGGLGVAGVSLLGTAGCGVFSGSQGGNGGGGGSSSKTLNTYIASDISGIDPSTAQGLYGNSVIANVMEGLYRLDENGEAEFGQAKSVDLSDDKLTHTFHLRDGIKWSNGDPVTSGDFKYAWLRGLAPETASVYAYVITDYIKGAKEYNSGDAGKDAVAIDTPDDKTLKVTLINPTPFFPDMVAHLSIYFPLKQSFVEKQGDKFAQGTDSMLYNGAYTMTDYNPSGNVNMKKNPDYWDASNVTIENVNQQNIKEAKTALNLYQNGQLDQVGLESEDVPRFKGTKEYSTETDFGTFYTVMNLEDDVMSNKNIRKALQLGFDREALQNKILNNGSTAADGFVPPGMKGPGNQTFREAQGAVLPTKFDAQKAKKYWDQGVQELGRTPKITMLSGDNSLSQKVSTFLQGQYQESLGTKVELNVKPFKASLDLLNKGNYQYSTATGWIADFNDPINFLNLFITGGAQNYPKLSNDQYDSLISSASKETDPNKRMDMLMQAEEILINEAVAIGPEYYEGHAYLTKPRIKKWVIQKVGGSTYRLWRLGNG